MRKCFLRKITAITLSVLMGIFLFACGGNPPQNSSYPANGARKIVTVNKEIYLSAEQVYPLSVAHYENESEILLIEINYAVEQLINSLTLGGFPNSSVTIEETDTAVTLTRENGAFCILNFLEDTVYFSDFDSFSTKEYDANPHDLLSIPYLNAEGNSVYIQRNLSFFTPGYGILINLAERNIPLDIYQGKKYIPLQTFNDLFISPFGINVAYNGESIFLIFGSSLSPDLVEKYYHEEKTDRSAALSQFNYNELCLYLDLYYGLQDEHGFNNGFTYYLEKIGLKEKFLDPDAINAYNALGTVTMGYIADLHSGITAASPYLGVSQPTEGVDVKMAGEIMTHIENMQIYQQTRATQLGEVKFYEKVGNTAYVTFDEFTMGDRTGDYGPNVLEIADTLTIIMTAHEQITNDEEIENVVVDLSCNGGGVIDSGIYLVSWMLGYCDFAVYNSITQSRAITSYKADVNLDGIFDAQDTITDKNLYCIVSPVSFSCGNYAPALLKASDKVTILGRTSSGGGCVVRHAVTADGTLFNISDARQMSIVKNGSYYGVDEGVEPDVALTKIESFYNRVELTQYINDLK